MNGAIFKHHKNVFEFPIFNKKKTLIAWFIIHGVNVHGFYFYDREADRNGTTTVLDLDFFVDINPVTCLCDQPGNNTSYSCIKSLHNELYV